MAVIKQKTIGGETYVLKQEKTFKDDKQFEYFVAKQNGGPVGDPVYTRREGMQMFRETVRAVQRAEGEDRNEARGGMGPSMPAFGDSGGGSPGLPGFGMDEEDDDDDDGPSLPFF